MTWALRARAPRAGGECGGLGGGGESGLLRCCAGEWLGAGAKERASGVPHHSQVCLWESSACAWMNAVSVSSLNCGYPPGRTTHGAAKGGSARQQKRGEQTRRERLRGGGERQRRGRWLRGVRCFEAGAAIARLPHGLAAAGDARAEVRDVAENLLERSVRGHAELGAPLGGLRLPAASGGGEGMGCGGGGIEQRRVSALRRRWRGVQGRSGGGARPRPKGRGGGRRPAAHVISRRWAKTERSQSLAAARGASSPQTRELFDTQHPCGCARVRAGGRAAAAAVGSAGASRPEARRLPLRPGQREGSGWQRASGWRGAPRLHEHCVLDERGEDVLVGGALGHQPLELVEAQHLPGSGGWGGGGARGLGSAPSFSACRGRVRGVRGSLRRAWLRPWEKTVRRRSDTDSVSRKVRERCPAAASGGGSRGGGEARAQRALSGADATQGDGGGGRLLRRALAPSSSSIDWGADRDGMRDVCEEEAKGGG